MISHPTRLALLLTLRLDPGATTALKPLDVSEMTKLGQWIHTQERSWLDLITQPAAALEGWENRRITSERVTRLLQRNDQIDRKIEQWDRHSVWIVGRKDTAYPDRLRERLGESRPPILFGIGSQQHLDDEATAIVGSRDTTLQTLQRAEKLGGEEAQDGKIVISGGARGVDERAVQGALTANGSALVVLGDSLLTSARKVQYEEYLAQETLTLISPYSPEAGFTSGNAMGRNRLIYCLADRAIVVASVNGSGGTFGGAMEAIRRQWVPVHAVPSNDPRSGNRLLIEAGATPYSPRPSTSTLPAFPARTGEEQNVADLYHHFLDAWRRLETDEVRLSDIAEALNLTPEQTRDWVFAAVERKDAIRLAHPIRYILNKV